ncbi:HD domain-containing protein [bacterium]|nr:HD domain-containing protein [bacterium]
MDDTPLAVPDAPIFAEAADMLRQSAPPAVFNHSLRCFFLARAFARKRSIPFDEGDLYLVSLFHDLGLCPGHRRPRIPFTVSGAYELRRFLLAGGYGDERIGPLADAIRYHMLPFPKWSKGNLAGLIHVGAWMDVFGRKKRVIRPEVRRIEEQFPRYDLGAQICRCFLASTRSATAVWGLYLPDRVRLPTVGMPVKRK